jgi:hypothetical protein
MGRCQPLLDVGLFPAQLPDLQLQGVGNRAVADSGPVREVRGGRSPQLGDARSELSVPVEEVDRHRCQPGDRPEGEAA